MASYWDRTDEWRRLLRQRERELEKIKRGLSGCSEQQLRDGFGRLVSRLLKEPSKHDRGGQTSSRRTSGIVTTTIGRSGSRVEVVHDRERCYGYLRPRGTGFKAWWSGDRFDDHYIGEFTTKPAAIDAVVTAAQAMIHRTNERSEHHG
jgi:hypothetical protein